MSHVALTLWAGVVIGLLFGAVGQASGFCLLRGVANSAKGDSRKLRAFVLAMATALLGTQWLAALGYFSLSNSLYITPSFSWLALPLGGLLFGYGMALANGCGARSLVLLGSGNLRSVVVVMCLGIGAYMALSGVLAPGRIYLEQATSIPLTTQDIAGLVALPGWAVASLLGLPIAAWAFSSAHFRASPRDWISGLIVGSLVPAGWYATGVLGFDDFEPVRLASLTFVAPIGASLQYVMLSTGTRLSFGVAVVGGIILGALITALIRRDFHWQGFQGPGQMARSMVGAMMMGIGGVLALGCSIGQGITGMSTLALPSLIALLCILLGAYLGVKGPLALSHMANNHRSLH